MKSIRLVSHNIIANFFGGAWASLSNLIFIPFLIKILGVEAYGLIGIYLSLIALLVVLDLGLSATLSRQLSRLSVLSDSDQEARDLVRTLEMIYWGMGILIAVVLILLAPFIARDWIHPQNISVDTVKNTLMLMGLSVAFQWPSSLYSGGLMGLQRQVLLNGVRIVIVTLQYGGALLLLLFISPSILTFFIWQTFMSMTNTLVLLICLWKVLPASRRPAQFSSLLLKKNWHFAAGMTGISALVTILTQLDKIILSKMLTLEFFGYYTLAFGLASILSQLVTPIYSALFPLFSQIAANENAEGLSSLYHKGCQLVAIIVLPVAVTVVFFSKEMLAMWLKDPLIVANTHVLLSLLVIGTALNTLMVLPYALQLAYGLTRIIFLQNAVSVVLLVPLMIWMISHYGPTGAAIVWIILNLAYVFILIPVMHRHILRSEMWRWYSFDLALPVSITLMVALCGRLLIPLHSNMYLLGGGIAATYVAGLLSLIWTFSLTKYKIIANPPRTIHE